MFALKIETSNDAFRSCPDELARLLTELAGMFRNGVPEDECASRIRDLFGNTCGRWEYTPE